MVNLDSLRIGVHSPIVTQGRNVDSSSKKCNIVPVIRANSSTKKDTLIELGIKNSLGVQNIEENASHTKYIRIYKMHLLNYFTEWKFYDKDSLVAKQKMYVNGRTIYRQEGEIPDCIAQYYYKDGGIREEYTYKNNARNGISRKYFNTGEVEEECTYNSSGFYINTPGTTLRIEGLFKVYYKNGTIHEEYNYINGVREGSCRIYGSDGWLCAEGNYKNDKLDGIYKSYNKDGKRPIETHYSKGNKTGIKRIYHDNGQVSTEYKYVNDNQHGIQKTYYDNGVLESEYNANKGRPDGKDNTYYPNGSLHFQRIWNNGVEVSFIKFDTLGNVVEKRSFPH